MGAGQRPALPVRAGGRGAEHLAEGPGPAAGGARGGPGRRRGPGVERRRGRRGTRHGHRRVTVRDRVAAAPSHRRHVGRRHHPGLGAPVPGGAGLAGRAPPRRRVAAGRHGPAAHPAGDGPRGRPHAAHPARVHAPPRGPGHHVPPPRGRGQRVPRRSVPRRTPPRRVPPGGPARRHGRRRPREDRAPGGLRRPGRRRPDPRIRRRDQLLEHALCAERLLIVRQARSQRTNDKVALPVAISWLLDRLGAAPSPVAHPPRPRRPGTSMLRPASTPPPSPGRSPGTAVPRCRPGTSGAEPPPGRALSAPHQSRSASSSWLSSSRTRPGPSSRARRASPSTGRPKSRTRSHSRPADSSAGRSCPTCWARGKQG